MNGHLSQRELETYLWGAAKLLRGLVDAGDYKQYIFPLLFFKRLSDVWNEDYAAVIVMVDEAHRTQEGDLGRKMREALPNAFLFGLTGTPINRADRNTFYAFGADEDEHDYMSRYGFEESIRDGATKPLHFEPRLLELHIDREAIDQAFKEMTGGLSDLDRDQLAKTAAKMAVLVKSPERIQKICADIARHFQDKIAPLGFGAQVVVFDRESCVLYKQALDEHLPPEMSAVVMTVNNGETEYAAYKRDRAAEEKLLDRFRDPADPLKILIVTSKLLTGFDASTSGKGTNNPEPLLLRIQTPAVLPNDIKANMAGCFVIAEAVGRLDKERADVRLVSLSCLSNEGKAIIDTQVKGFVTDSDSKVGLSGRVVSRMGSATARTIVAGFFGGMGDMLKSAATTQSTSALGTTTTIDSSQVAKYSIGGGLSDGAASLQEFYLSLAKQATPVIEVGAAKEITVIVSEGKELEIKEFESDTL